MVLGIVQALKEFFGFLGRVTGLISDEKLRQAGRDESAKDQLQEGSDAQERIDAVDPVNERELTDSLQRGDF